ncbi:MAG: transposase [Phycisphaeraceae bacterium]|nr:transposase [Phycisphaeraceae bacterium]
MVFAYHVILSTYGFWLPNDPRGSWSDFVRSWELRRWGPATKVHTRHSVAAQQHDVRKRFVAKEALLHKPVRFTGPQARTVGQAFSRIASSSGYKIHACAVLPDHLHLVIGRHSYAVEQIVRRLKQAATRALVEEGLWSSSVVPSPWARGLWKVYLNSAVAVQQAVEYVEQNPIRAGFKAQKWVFVTPYLG